MPRITHTREDGMVLQRQECPAFTVHEEGGGLVLCGSTLGNAFNARFAITAGELEVLLRFVATELPAAFARAQGYLDPQVPRPLKPIDGCLSVVQPCARANAGYSDPCDICQGKKDPRDDDLKLSPEQIAAIFANGRHESPGGPGHAHAHTPPVEREHEKSARVLDFPPPDPSAVERAKKHAAAALASRLPASGPIVEALELLMRTLIVESTLPAINMHPDHVAVQCGGRTLIGPPELVIKAERPAPAPYEPGEDRF